MTRRPAAQMIVSQSSSAFRVETHRERTTVTTNTAVNQPTTGVKATGVVRNLLIVVAGVGTSVLTAVAAALLLQCPRARTIIGLVVGTLLVGLLMGATTVKRWAYAFGLLILGQMILGFVAIFTVLGPAAGY